MDTASADFHFKHVALSYRICVDCIAKNVNNFKMLQNQLPSLPRKLLEAVQRRTSRII
jgi:hypothetical protein